MEKGTLVEFRLHGDRRLAVIERPEGKKNWVVIDGRGQSHTLHPRQFSYQVVGKQYTATDIERFVSDCQPYLDPSSLEVAWEFLVEDGQSVTPSALAELLFSETTPVSCYAAHSLLAEDKLYFKQKGDRYEPRSINQVADLKHQLEREQQRLQERNGFFERVQTALQGELVDWERSDRQWLDALERLAAMGDESTNKAPAHDVLTTLNRAKTQGAAFQLLVDLHLWDAHENLFLKRYQVPTQFPSGVSELAAQCLRSPIPDADEQRLDLTHLKVSTIDDESTREIDDGLSIEFLDDGRQRIWIHIADPSRWIARGDAIDLEARRRSTTIYLPTGIIPMFPPELATGPMSLVQGEVCHALSFGVILDENGAIADYEIHPSLIKPTYRLTYDDVDEILQLGVEAEPELEALYQWSKRRERWRLEQGAVSIRMPEASIKVQDDEITITVLEDSASRQMVAEMMILTGEIAGHYGQEHNLALPFRGQPQPELPPEEELMVLPAGPVRDSAVRRCMSRSEMGITPLRHAGLGLDTYTQSTSPIRRYTDLLCHFQIKAHLRGDEVPFSPEALQELIQVVSNTAYEAVLIERQTNRYWSVEYLRRHGGEVWQALMLRWLREHENLGLVLLEELGLEMVVRFQRPVALGDRLTLKVTYADPRQDTIQFAESSGIATE
ncbi:MAG: VacB/RNase II family 3'-5' exoribonuclease [Merismopedia sp. SIO2A8]|nr:VacB/RNase II family 3'-5' exoribonuclease [Merismopedia sp. SIO2A8]